MDGRKGDELMIGCHLLRLARRAGSFEAVTMAQFRADILADPIPNLAFHDLGEECGQIARR